VGDAEGAILSDWLRLARPAHWLKSGFILLPVPFAVADGAHVDGVPLALGVAGFSLLASAVYVLNDLADAARDRLHPVKRDRPLAARRVGRGGAAVYAALLAAAGLGLCAAAAPPWLPLAYLAAATLYSAGAKHVALLDVFLIATGFVFRVLWGCRLVAAPPSDWLLVCTSALALLLALAKRNADLAAGLDEAHRPSLAGYDPAFLRQAMGVAAGVVLLGYSLYAMNSGAFRRGRELASVPFVVFAVLDYLRLAQVHGAGASPFDAVRRAPRLAFVFLGWLAAVAWSLDF